MKNVSMDEFIKNVEKQDAVVRNFEIIGEATRRVDNEFKVTYTQIPWKTMKGMRNFLIHEYDVVDLKLVWDAVHDDLPELKIKIENLLKKNTA